MDQDAALGKRFDRVSGCIIPGNLRRLAWGRWKRMREIELMSFLGQFARDGAFRNPFEFFGPVEP